MKDPGWHVENRVIILSRVNQANYSGREAERRDYKSHSTKEWYANQGALCDKEGTLARKNALFAGEHSESEAMLKLRNSDVRRARMIPVELPSQNGW